MRRNATLSLDDLDPEVLDAARDVARRAGVPLETWIDSVVGGEAKLSRAGLPQEAAEPVVERRRRKRAGDGAPAAAEPRVSSIARAAPAETAPRDFSESVGKSIGAMVRRLDALDRSLAENRKDSENAAAQAIAKLEGRIAEALDQAPSDALVGKLDEIERRMNDLHGQLSGPRPIGRRGRPLVAEMRDAVEQVRQRQRELDAAGEAEPAQMSAAPSPAITNIQRETANLRDSLGALATGRDVGALEQAMRTLVSDVQRAREPGDLAAIAAAARLIRMQIDRLAEQADENVHARISGDVTRLASKVDATLSSPVSHADRAALAGVQRELEEIGRQLGALAKPARIAELAQSLQVISGQITQRQGAVSDAAGVDTLKPLLEEIRKGISAPERSSKAILGRIDALADKLDRVGANPGGDILGRLDDLSARLQRPADGGADFAAIQKMLRTLADKVDHVHSGSGAESLDALEKQVVGIARRLDAQRADPALAGLERMMSDLLGQVTALCGDGVEAAVERATRRAVVETADRDSVGTGSAGVDQLRSDLAEIASRQAAADHRMQATMGNLNTMLERLVDRLGPATGGEGPAYRAAPRDEDDRSLSERLMASTMPVGHSPIAQPPLPPVAPEALPRTRQQRRPDAPRQPGADAARLTDELLEPGSARPRPGATPVVEAREPAQAGADIKANFIAAARRAAQAAQADLGTSAAPERRGERGVRPVTKASAAPAATGGLVARLRSELDNRRRPLLLGLAAIVLVLGAFQAFTMTTGDTASDAAKVAAAPPVEQPARAAQAPTVETPAAKAAKADPTTTQSLADPAPVRATAAAKSGVPKIAGMDALKQELGNVPIALASLKQAALDGDGASIYDLASREADGRGVTRDLAVAAKLYEKLATDGFAPAQFKLGSAYEKGSGLVRDLEEAKIWYGRAAEQGNSRAMHNLAVVHAENPAVGGKPDFATAASWFRRAAEYGVRDSQYNLAVLYARGLGMNQDLVQSYAWFNAAAAQGDEEAGKKRDDVANKLAPKDLTTAKGIAAAFKPKPADPLANDSPAPKPAAPAAMSLLGAPPPGSPTSNGFTPPRSLPQSGV